MTPAQRIIGKCGGEAAVAKMVGVDISRVHRWKYPKEKGGTGGTIPHRHQQTLLDKAQAAGIDVSPADFFAVEGDLYPADREASASA